MNGENPADNETLRNEIQAAIAAGRELSPDMDAHLADSVLERYRTEQQARAKALVPQQRQATPPAPVTRGPGTSIERIVLGVACLAAIVALVAFTHIWWIIFFVPWLLGGWWGYGRWHGPSGGSRYALRDQRQQQRIQSMRSELDRLPDGSVHYD